MYVIEKTLGTEPSPPMGRLFRIFMSCLQAIIPAANPDFENSYESVCKWWIEINAAGEPERELGFDEHGKVIVAAPLGENFGVFTDSNATFTPGEHRSVEPGLFEATWSRFENEFAERQSQGQGARPH